MENKPVREEYNIINSILKIHLGMILFLVPLFFVPNLQTSRSIIDLKITLTQFLGGACLTIFGIGVLFRKIKFPQINILNIGVFILLIDICLSSLFSVNFFLTIKESLMIISFIIFFFIVQSTIITEDDGIKLLKYSFIAGILVFLIGLSQYLGFDPLQPLLKYKYSDVREGRGFFLSTLGNPEYTGSYLAVISCIYFAYMIGEVSKRNFIVNLFIFLIFFTGLIISGARGAFIGFFISIVFCLYVAVKMNFLKISKKIKIVIFLIFLISAGIVTIFSFPNPFNIRNTFLLKRFQDLTDIRSESLKERIVFYCTSTEIIAKSPLIGSGAGSFKRNYFNAIKRLVENDEKAGMVQFIYSSRNRLAEYTHCDYLQICAELGVIGLGAFLWIFCVIFYTYKRYLSSIKGLNENKKIFFYRLSIYCGIICILVNAIFSFPLQLPARGSLLWILAGLSAVSMKDYITNINLKGEKSN